MPDIEELKKKIRDNVRGVLRDNMEWTSRDAPLKVRDHFLAHFKHLDSKLVIAGTVPMGHELSPVPLMEALQNRGHVLCLPVANERATPLLFRAYAIGDALIPNKWNIGIPYETGAVLVPDILLCPMLAFDRTGARLGQGGGYYDATLQTLREQKTIIAVGLACSLQEVNAMPMGDHDQKLDVIITENEVLVPDRQRGIVSV